MEELAHDKVVEEKVPGQSPYSFAMSKTRRDGTFRGSVAAMSKTRLRSKRSDLNWTKDEEKGMRCQRLANGGTLRGSVEISGNVSQLAWCRRYFYIYHSRVHIE